MHENLRTATNVHFLNDQIIDMNFHDIQILNIVGVTKKANVTCFQEY